MDSALGSSVYKILRLPSLDNYFDNYGPDEGYYIVQIKDISVYLLEILTSEFRNYENIKILTNDQKVSGVDFINWFVPKAKPFVPYTQLLRIS